ncbi:MAG: hypothetical protein IT344_08395, partial [Candidatus Dadabacteria bacterium]|nr:hypothetical protein [Candidatus Dadabacteria bacterium]
MATDVAAKVAEWITGARKIVVLTGPELSAECGLPDFADPAMNPPAMDFREDRAVRAEYWKKIRAAYPLLSSTEPGPSHKALAELEMIANLDCIFTQTTDGLHHKAGSSAVIELNSSVLWA